MLQRTGSALSRRSRPLLLPTQLVEGCALQGRGQPLHFRRWFGLASASFTPSTDDTTVGSTCSCGGPSSDQVGDVRHDTVIGTARPAELVVPPDLGIHDDQITRAQVARPHEVSWLAFPHQPHFDRRRGLSALRLIVGRRLGDTTESRSLAVAPASSPPRRNLIACVSGTSTASAGRGRIRPQHLGASSAADSGPPDDSNRRLRLAHSVEVGRDRVVGVR